MELQEIESLLAHRETLTDEQKEKIVEAIYKNPQANEIAQRGAFVSGNYGLMANLQWHKLSYQK